MLRLLLNLEHAREFLTEFVLNLLAMFLRVFTPDHGAAVSECTVTMSIIGEGRLLTFAWLTPLPFDLEDVEHAEVAVGGSKTGNCQYLRQSQPRG